MSEAPSERHGNWPRGPLPSIGVDKVAVAVGLDFVFDTNSTVNSTLAWVDAGAWDSCTLVALLERANTWTDDSSVRVRVWSAMCDPADPQMTFLGPLAAEVQFSFDTPAPVLEIATLPSLRAAQLRVDLELRGTSVIEPPHAHTGRISIWLVGRCASLEDDT